jgi:probable addiction module antidote protein
MTEAIKRLPPELKRKRGEHGNCARQTIGKGNRVMDTNAKTIPWDASDYLKTDDDIAEYLAAAFETGEVDDVTHALATIARARGMTETAKTAGLSRGTLYKAIGEGANPTLSTFLSVLSAMNISLSAKPKAA